MADNPPLPHAAHVARLAADQATARRLADVLAENLEDQGAATAAFEEPDGRWALAIHFPAPPNETAVRALVALCAGAELANALTFERIEAKDWVTASLAGLAPVEAGRFVVHGRHDRTRVGINRIGIEIEAALAFGTGHHGTTRSCLLALDELVKRHRFYLSPRAGRGRPPERSEGGRVRERCRKPQAPPHPARNFVARHPLRARGEREKSIRILDIGAGTGVLAIAAARALRRPVLASDIDRLAVKVARANARANKAGALIEIIHAGDLHHRRFRAGAPFDIILANILLVPLQRMARPLAQLVAPGGKVVLSGLLTSQALAALAAYRAQGLVLERRIVLEGWTTLVMKRPTLPP